MKKNILYTFLSIMLISSIALTGCDNDDDGTSPTNNTKTYALAALNDSGVSGTATFTEFSDGSTEIVLDVVGTTSGNTHPAHIHFNSAAEGGGIAVGLTPVDGATGTSTTLVTALDDGTSISYEELLNFDGYINIHLSPEELATIVAQTDIGQNELTGNSIVYSLGEKDVPNISGTATFFERQNGESLAEIVLLNTPEGGVHPAHIHANSASEGGAIILSFNPVDGTTGISKTNISSLDDMTPLLYADIESLDAYINVHLSADELATIVAQGNIGINEGTPTDAVTYTVSNSGASAYIFSGNGLADEQNPDITLQRGMTYVFNVDVPGHPFYIKTAQSTGTGDTYDDGVTNNGNVTGSITFVVPNDAPDTLFYICEFHGAMSGTISIID